MNETWTVTEAPATYFVRQDEVEEQLEKTGITKNTALQMALMKATVIATGKYDVEMAEWEAKDSADKTFAKFQLFIKKVGQEECQ